MLREVLERQALGAGAFTKISTMHPTMKDWTPTGVTLLGDVTPRNDACRNTALQEAHVHLECLLSKENSVADISDYEAKMR